VGDRGIESAELMADGDRGFPSAQTQSIIDRGNRVSHYLVQ